MFQKTPKETIIQIQILNHKIYFVEVKVSFIHLIQAFLEFINLNLFLELSNILQNTHDLSSVSIYRTKNSKSLKLLFCEAKHFQPFASSYTNKRKNLYSINTVVDYENGSSRFSFNWVIQKRKNQKIVRILELQKSPLIPFKYRPFQQATSTSQISTSFTCKNLFKNCIPKALNYNFKI